jgi:hypothetical protein
MCRISVYPSSNPIGHKSSQSCLYPFSVFLHLIYIYRPQTPNLTASLTSLLPTTADATVHSAPTPTSSALAIFSVAHLSINSLTVSPSLANASTFLSRSEALARSSFLASSFSFVGPRTRSVKGTMLGRRMVARALRRKAVELRSSVGVLAGIQSGGWEMGRTMVCQVSSCQG